MNRLSTDQAGSSGCGAGRGELHQRNVRMTGVAKHSVLNLLRILAAPVPLIITATSAASGSGGCNATKSGHSSEPRKRTLHQSKKQNGWGDSWTWTAIDADSKLCVTYYVGDRGGAAAHEFMQDCAERIIGRPQITTDAHDHI